MEDWISHIGDFVRQHQVWAIQNSFLLAFGESLAFLSLLLPATIILLGLGALIGEAGIPFWPIFIAAAGSFFGDWLSYWLGDHYQLRVYHLWPFTRHPAMLERGHAFFMRWGIAGVFLGRFRPAAGGRAARCRAVRYAAARVLARQSAVRGAMGVRPAGARRIRPALAGAFRRSIKESGHLYSSPLT